MGFWIWGLGFGDSDLGFKVEEEFRVESLRFRVRARETTLIQYNLGPDGFHSACFEPKLCTSIAQQFRFSFSRCDQKCHSPILPILSVRG